ncbi:MAG: hypothetical protein ACFFG0_40300 [Candidatus Thorarchaeota archaeon]
MKELKDFISEVLAEISKISYDVSFEIGLIERDGKIYVVNGSDNRIKFSCKRK